MNSNKFMSIKDITDLGETIVCVYIFKQYEYRTIVQFMKWKGFRTDLAYSYNTVTIFFQDEKFVPNIKPEFKIAREIPETEIWLNTPNASENDYRYRTISEGIVCISFITE